MKVKQIYERVCLILPVDERRFFDRLNDTISVLCSRYGEIPKLLWEKTEGEDYPDGQWITSFEDELKLLPLYHVSLADNILYLSGAGEAYEQLFMSKAREAYLTYWNRNAKGRRIRKEGRRCV